MCALWLSTVNFFLSFNLIALIQSCCTNNYIKFTGYGATKLIWLSLQSNLIASWKVNLKANTIGATEFENQINVIKLNELNRVYREVRGSITLY